VLGQRRDLDRLAEPGCRPADDALVLGMCPEHCIDVFLLERP
jgi:hypothetical protein